MQHFLPDHPGFVHFPLGLLAAAFVFELLGLIFRRDSLHDLGRGALFLGTLAALAAVGTGLAAEGLVKPVPRALGSLLDLHKLLALATAALAVILSMWRISVRKRYHGGVRAAFVAALAALAVAVLWTGHVGGRMVYDHGAGVTVGRRTYAAPRGTPAASSPNTPRPAGEAEAP